MSERIDAYAGALLAVGRSEGRLADVEDEVYRFAHTAAGNEELRLALSDPQLPLARKLALIEDLLGGGRALATTVALIAMVVAAGRAGDLVAIADRFVELAAHEREREVAEVRSAVALSEDQVRRLADALSESRRTRVEVRNLVDPSVLGGITVRIGETVIDGTVRHRIDQLKELVQ